MKDGEVGAGTVSRFASYLLGLHLYASETGRSHLIQTDKERTVALACYGKTAVHTHAGFAYPDTNNVW